MGRDNELIHLEQHIERLLQGYAALQAENQRLGRELQQLANENGLIRQQLAAMNDERGDARVRVSSLIERIERWETELEGETAAVDSKVEQVLTAAEEGASEDQLASTRSEETTKRKQERDGGIQGSLFSG